MPHGYFWNARVSLDLAVHLRCCIRPHQPQAALDLLRRRRLAGDRADIVLAAIDGVAGTRLSAAMQPGFSWLDTLQSMQS